MGRSGPPPTPTAILAARGSWRAKTRAGEPQKLEGECVPSFKLTPRAQRYFDRARGWLNALNVLSRSDSHTLTRYAVMLDRWESQAKSRDGDVLKFHEALLRIEREFGLTPSARARLVQTGANPGGDASDDFFAKLKVARA